MIPIVIAKGKTLPEAYENSLIELYKHGKRAKTQYDGVDEPPSIDATANITIEEPETEPSIYKLFPGGVEDLREYVMELQGAKDHWCKNMDDPKDTRWEYTYHQRLTKWGTWKESAQQIAPIGSINQIERMVEKLVEAPYTRRAQAITWMPFMDNNVDDPPCLQSIWCRMTDEKKCWALNINIRFRSNDAWGAAFMNMFGLTRFIRSNIITPIERAVGMTIKMGRINWQADSYHIYGKNIEDFENRFIKRYNPFTFEDRVWSIQDPDVKGSWDEAEKKILDKIAKFDAEHPK
jgi:thymidylate synthase